MGQLLLACRDHGVIGAVVWAKPLTRDLKTQSLIGLLPFTGSPWAKKLPGPAGWGLDLDRPLKPPLAGCWAKDPCGSPSEVASKISGLYSSRQPGCFTGFASTMVCPPNPSPSSWSQCWQQGTFDPCHGGQGTSGDMQPYQGGG